DGIRDFHVTGVQTCALPISTLIALSNLPKSPNEKGAWQARGSMPVNGPGSGYVVACEGGYYLGERGKGRAVDLQGKTIREFKGRSEERRVGKECRRPMNVTT